MPAGSRSKYSARSRSAAQRTVPSAHWRTRSGDWSPITTNGVSTTNVNDRGSTRFFKARTCASISLLDGRLAGALAGASSLRGAALWSVARTESAAAIRMAPSYATRASRIPFNSDDAPRTSRASPSHAPRLLPARDDRRAGRFGRPRRHGAAAHGLGDRGHADLPRDGRREPRVRRRGALRARPRRASRRAREGRRHDVAHERRAASGRAPDGPARAARRVDRPRGRGPRRDGEGMEGPLPRRGRPRSLGPRVRGARALRRHARPRVGAVGRPRRRAADARVQRRDRRRRRRRDAAVEAAHWIVDWRPIEVTSPKIDAPHFAPGGSTHSPCAKDVAPTSAGLAGIGSDAMPTPLTSSKRSRPRSSEPTNPTWRRIPRPNGSDPV